MKKFLSVLVLLVCFISGCSCDNDNNKKVKPISIFSYSVMAFSDKDNNYYTTTSPFGTYIKIAGYDEDDVYGIEEEFNELVFKYHSLLDRNYYYRDSDGAIINNIKVINDSYGSGEAILVDDIIIEILKEGIKYTKLSNGKFNIFAGKLVDTWDPRFSWLAGELYKVDPTETEINEALACVPTVSEIDSVLVIDEVNKTVKFNAIEGCASSASITLGALAKSYFLDKLNEVEDVRDLEDYILDAGQSSIIVSGDNPTREGGVYNIAITNSLVGGLAVHIQLSDDGAISTSSGDQKGYIKEDGTRRHHIIDATSGYPNTYLLATTVVSDSAMIADIMTTTLMTMESMEEIKAYLTLLQNNGVNAKVLLQVKENDSLKVYINSSMKSVVGQVVEGVTVEEFNYGAQA